MGESQKLGYATSAEAAQIADYLDKIADGLREGVVNLSNGQKTVIMEPMGAIKFEIEAEYDAEKGKGSIEVEVSWKASRVATPTEFMISATKVTKQEESAGAPAGTAETMKEKK